MKYVVMAVRLAFGVWYIMSGARYVQPGLPMGTDTVAKALLASLVNSNLMLGVKAVEFVVGVLLVLNLFVPAALVIGFPVTVVVAYVCLVLEWPLTRPMIGGGLSLAAHVFLLLAYFKYYRPMLTLKSKPFGG
ncbi:MAG: hypothetical protein ABIO39_08310 [Caulobacteraceae bacterium]